MGVEILKDERSGQQVMFCNTSDWAFGPVFHDDEDAESFLVFLAPVDPRSLTDTELARRVSDWRAAPGKWQCQECETKFKSPTDDCPECGGSDIDLIVPQSVKDVVARNMTMLGQRGSR